MPLPHNFGLHLEAAKQKGRNADAGLNKDWPEPQNMLMPVRFLSVQIKTSLPPVAQPALLDHPCSHRARPPPRSRAGAPCCSWGTEHWDNVGNTPYLPQGQHRDTPATSCKLCRAASPRGRWKDAFQAATGLGKTACEMLHREGEKEATKW